MSDNLGSTIEKAVHEEQGRWYFWDETWADRHGPYPTKEHAISSLVRYCDWLNKENQEIRNVQDPSDS